MDNDPTDERLRESALRVRTLLFDAYRYAGRDEDAKPLAGTDGHPALGVR